MLSKYVTSLRRLVEEFSEITFTELNISHSENESLRLREKQHNARLNMAINPKKIDFNRAHMWLNNIFFVFLITCSNQNIFISDSPFDVLLKYAHDTDAYTALP